MTAALLVVALGAAVPDGAALAPAVHAAVVEAVRARMGRDAEVVLSVVGEAPRDVGVVSDAVLEPGAALGVPVRMALRAPVVRGGTTALSAVAHVSVQFAVAVDHWHTTRAVPRGTRITEGDVTRVRHTLTRGAVRRPPADDEVLDARAVQALPEGTCLAARHLAPTAAVTAGAAVEGVVREGGIEVRAGLVAVDSGRIGDRVRVMHPESRRTFRARVVARAQVEISHDR